MRRPRYGLGAVLASLAGHLLLLLLLAIMAGSSAGPRRSPIEDPSVSVTLLDLAGEMPPSAPAIAIPPNSQLPASPVERRLDSAAATRPLEAPSRSSSPPDDDRRGGPLAMRTSNGPLDRPVGERPALSAPRRADDDGAPIAGPPEGILALRPLESAADVNSELRHRGGGHFTSDGGTFVARTRPDGTVEVVDRRNLRFRLNIPDKRMVSGLLRSWQKDPRAHALGESDVALPTDDIAGGSFDLTDGLMRVIGDDPYVVKKLQFLERTRDERAAIASVNKSEALADAARTARAQLARIAKDRRLSASEKRSLYFELWDECAEAGSDEVVDAARSVRATIIGFIGKRHPAGSAAAYTARELKAFNRVRASGERFEPYASTR